jgi:membrane protease YdiL (CAAX protease family)
MDDQTLCPTVEACLRVILAMEVRHERPPADHAPLDPVTGPTSLPGFGPAMVLGLLMSYFLLCTGLGILIGIWTAWLGSTDPALPPWLNVSLGELLFLPIAAMGFRALRLDWSQTVGRPPRDSWRTGACLVLGWLGSLALEIFTMERVLARWPQLLPALPDQSFATALIPMVFMAPLAEEAFFRGVLCEGLARRYGNAIGITVSATLFALCHWPWVRWPWCFVFGLILGAMHRRTGSLLPCLLIHATNNALSLMYPDHLYGVFTLAGLASMGALAVLAMQPPPPPPRTESP